MAKGYILVEGHGEVEAAGNLVSRLWYEAGGTQPWAPPIRWKNLHLKRGIESGVERIRAQEDAGASTFLRAAPTSRRSISSR